VWLEVRNETLRLRSLRELRSRSDSADGRGEEAGWLECEWQRAIFEPLNLVQ